MRLELTRPCSHYPLKVACIPISPPALIFIIDELNWCPEQDSNLHVAKHSHLKRARLPIPPSGLKPVGSDLEKKQEGILLLSKWERKTRLELATPTLARLCSTN